MRNYVRKMRNLGLAIVVFSLLATPALAQKGRSNKGGATTGPARADQVQLQNKKGDKDPNPSKGSKAEKTRTREGWEKKAQHKAKAKGHSK